MLLIEIHCLLFTSVLQTNLTQYNLTKNFTCTETSLDKCIFSIIKLLLYTKNSICTNCQLLCVQFLSKFDKQFTVARLFLLHSLMDLWIMCTISVKVWQTVHCSSLFIPVTQFNGSMNFLLLLPLTYTQTHSNIVVYCISCFLTLLHLLRPDPTSSPSLTIYISVSLSSSSLSLSLFPFLSSSFLNYNPITLYFCSKENKRKKVNMHTYSPMY